MSLEAAIAVHRFGLGARPGEIEGVGADPKAWLTAQIGMAAEQPVAPDGGAFPNCGTLVRQEQAMIAERRAIKAGDPEAQKKLAGGRMKIFTDETAGRTLNFCGAFEREAIRPFIADKFENMLLAVASHPAMLVYLNNNASIGPDSPAGQRTGKGRNENLGRELMELYSVGVDGGYTQADVIALANILTGWGLDSNAPSGFGFFPNR